MKPLVQGVLVIFLLAAGLPAQAKVILVNTTNNVSPGPGETNLVQAIRLLQDGDSIRFNLPGTGPFYLITPPLVPDNGYPAITNHNVTIDGYSQPGAWPNTNPILGTNNAQIQIVLDSRSGGVRVEDIPGYSTGESAVLFIKGATNVTVRGFCFLGPGVGGGNDGDPSTYAISFALGADSGHVSGCWIGVDLDRTTVYRFQDTVTGFQGSSGTLVNNIVVGVEPGAASVLAARSQFNVMVGEYIPLVLEGRNIRIAGNFLNVFPDGMTDYNVSGDPPFNIQAFIEIGRSGDNLVLGTDGDGVNDAEERNVFGGVTAADDHQIVEWYGGSRTNMVIAGNYFGMAVDGATRFTNSMKLFGGFNSSTTVRIGSDFDGVSDDIEGNVIAMNYPFDLLFPTDLGHAPPIFADLAAGARVSLRGNRLIGNNILPFSYADNYGDRLTAFTNYYAGFVQTSQIIPALLTNSTQGRLKGTCGLGVLPYTNVIIDFYLADGEGWTNGQEFQWSDLTYTEPGTGLNKYYGFAEGRTYLGSFIDNGPQDLDLTPGQFEFDIGALNVDPETLVTVAASYSADPPGTRDGRIHTSPFATPITLQPAPRIGIVKSGNSVTLSWPATQGLFRIQSMPVTGSSLWGDLDLQPMIAHVGSNYQVLLPITVNATFLRLAR
jgi:hypothetical protein